MPDHGSIATALDHVGPRLQRVRMERSVTLADLAQRPGVCNGTLSRLGSRARTRRREPAG